MLVIVSVPFIAKDLKSHINDPYLALLHMLRLIRGCERGPSLVVTPNESLQLHRDTHVDELN